MAATIRDVSRLAGVSSATVSRAFSNPEKLTADTLEKVQAAARELKYKPNHLSTIFRSSKTMSIVVMVPDLSNAFFGPVLRGMEKVAGKQGYSLLLSDTHDSVELERSCIGMVESRRADGVIQLGARSLTDLAGDNSDIAFIHAIEAEPDSNEPSVRIDNVHAAAKIMRYILSQGHRTIGVLGGRENSRITAQRRQGYMQALMESGITVDPDLAEFGEYTHAFGEVAAARLLARRPDITALFCMSDDIAIGAMHAAKTAGLSLPRDLSVTGFDNVAFCSYTEPALTSIMQPAERIGEIAATVMLSRLSGEDVSDVHYVLPTELVIRGSVAKVSAAQ